MATISELKGTVDTAISALNTEVAQNSIPPSRMASILSNMETLEGQRHTEATTGDVEATRVSGRLTTSQLPTDMPPGWELQFFVSLWRAAMHDTPNDPTNQERDADGNLINCYTYIDDKGDHYPAWNGYFPDATSMISQAVTFARNTSGTPFSVRPYCPTPALTPFCANGTWMNYDQAKVVLASMWVPGSSWISGAGLVTNKPYCAPLASDSANVMGLNLNLSCANNGHLRSLSLTHIPRVVAPADSPWDWEDPDTGVVFPISMVRFVNNAPTLRFIHGVIDCRYLTQEGVRSAFVGARQLRQVDLRNIPESVTTLDFTGCLRLSPHVINNLTFWRDGASTPVRAAGNPLTVKIDRTLHKIWSENMLVDGSATGFWQRYFSTWTFDNFRTEITRRNILLQVFNSGSIIQ